MVSLLLIDCKTNGKEKMNDAILPVRFANIPHVRHVACMTQTIPIERLIKIINKWETSKAVYRTH